MEEKPEIDQKEKEEPEYIVDELRLNKYMEERGERQSFSNGLLLGGGAAAALSAAIWATVTFTTGYQIGFMAIGVGFLVGYAVRIGGKGFEDRFGYLGGALALIGCLLGNLLATCAAISQQQTGMSFFDVILNLKLDFIVNIYKETFSPMDLIFYGLAVYEGYRFSFKPVTNEEVSQFITEKKKL